MRHARPFRIANLLFAAALLLATRGIAQSPVDPGQLPGRTNFYLLWHGTPSGEIRKNNSLYALWDDPDFATVRASFMESFLSNTQSQKTKPALSREEIAEYVTLLDNPFLVGYLRRPEAPAPAKSAPAKTTPAPAWSGMFLIYDRTGKEALLSKAVTHLRGAETEIPKLTELTIAGVPALKVERKEVVTYWAEFGKYAVSANEESVFEEILNVVNGTHAGSVLSQSSAFQEAKPLLSGGVVEFFLGIPNVQELSLDPSNATAAQMKPLLNSLKLDSIHSVAGKISLDGVKTHLTGAILGDTAPGGLFDIWGDGQANLASLRYVSTDTIYYGASQFNFLGVYDILKRAFTSAGGNSAQAVNPLEAAATARLGMPLPGALGLTTGEIGSIQSSPILDDKQKVYLLGIRNKPDALKLTRTLMGDRITSERNEGDVTFMKVSLQGGQSSSGVAQWNFYYLAMTPTLLLGSSKSETLHAYTSLSSTNAVPALPDAILTSRGQYPQRSNGFTYLDFQKVDWPGVKANWVAEANKSAQSAKSTDAAKNNKHFTDLLSQLDPAVFPRHLHTMSGASWKDAKGVHLDQWLD